MEKKNVFCLLFVAILLLKGTYLYAIVYNGTCGTNLTWTLDSEEGVLVVTGTGEMTGSTYCMSPLNQYVKHVQLPEGLTALGQGALGNCQFLEDVTIPDNVTSIGERAFFFCKTLESIVIPDKVSIIGIGAFQDCTHLKSMTLPAGVTSIGQGAFYGCARMTSVNIPDGITTIYANTFQDCKALPQIVIPASVTTIGEQAFAGDLALRMITCFATNPPVIYENTFENVTDDAFLTVPDESYYLYKGSSYWGRFRMKEAPYEEVPQKIVVTAAETTADFTWPTDADASSYQIDIYKDGAVFCKLTLNAIGQLIGIAFEAPRKEQKENTNSTNEIPSTLSFIVTGLDKASRYNYVFSALDDHDTPLHVYTGDFATLGYEGELKGGGDEVIPTPPIIPSNPEGSSTSINDITDYPHTGSKIVFKEGQLVLIIDNIPYSLTGQRIQ